MVKFIDVSDSANPEGAAHTEDAHDSLAPVTYLPGVSRDSMPGSSSSGSAGTRSSQRSSSTARVSTRGETGHNEADNEPADAATVESVIVRSLARRSLSESEVLDLAIKTHGLEPRSANDVLDHLRELGYVNDRALAEQLRLTLHGRKGQSRAVVARTMSSRGIDREIVGEVLDDIADDDELAQATELAAKRASTLTRVDAETAERRLVGYLARRGYPGHIARQAITTALERRRSGVHFSENVH
ncbi:hypothetical protein GCM10027416_25100 [Okibacterium endophyticum]